MDVSIGTVIAVVLLDAIVSIRYCIKLVRREIAPRLATWLIFEVGVLMSLAAYWTSRNHDLMKAALNVTDAVLVTVVLALVVVKRTGHGLQFTKNEWRCLVVACLASILWLLTKTSWVGLVGFQMVMSVAYLPTLESVWHWRPGPPPEPIDKWSINILIAVLGIIPSLTGHRDYLAMIYPLRALVLCVFVVALILRWILKGKDELRIPF